MNTKDADLSRQLTTRCDEARAALWKHMADRALRIEDGWRIHEFTRQMDGRMELVMRPVHSRLSAPPDLECWCAIDEPSSAVSSDCRE